MAARAEPMAKVMEMVRVDVDAHELGRRPCPRSTARMALPILVLAGEQR